MTNLAAFIKERRESMEISQGKLGKALGFQSGQFISNIELSEDIQYPACYFKKISKILKFNIKDLIKIALTDFEIKLRHEIRRSK